MTAQQEVDLRKAFEEALAKERDSAEARDSGGPAVWRVETTIEGVGDSAVILVVGVDLTFEVVQFVDKIMEKMKASA